MKKAVLPILISLTMVIGMTSVCMAKDPEDTTVSETIETTVEDTTVAEATETQTEAPTEATTEAPTEAPTETSADLTPTSVVNQESEYLFKTPFVVTVQKENTVIYSDATCTASRLVGIGEQLTVIGTDGTFFKLDSGEYVVNFALSIPEDASWERADVEEPQETTAETEPSESTEDSKRKIGGIEIYDPDEKDDDDDGTIKAKEEEKNDPRFTIFCFACGLGLALGALGGFFLGGWWNKRKMNKEDDRIYNAIKYGETKEALDKEKKMIAKERAEEKALKQAEAKKKREEKIQSLKDMKSNLAEKKAEKARQKDIEDLKKLQERLGIAPTQQETVEQPVSAPIQREVQPEVEEDPDAFEVPVSEKPPFQVAMMEQQIVKEEPKTTTEQQQEVVNEPQPQEIRENFAKAQDVVDAAPRYAMVEKPQRRPQIRPEDYEYGGKDNAGVDFYWDHDEPFRIKNGRKVLYSSDPNHPFVDEDGNEVVWED